MDTVEKGRVVSHVVGVAADMQKKSSRLERHAPDVNMDLRSIVFSRFKCQLHDCLKCLPTRLMLSTVR